MVDAFFSTGLFGRHVAGRSEHRARGGEVPRLFMLGELGDPEIQNPDHGDAVLDREEHVVGLEIAVNDSACMR